MRRATVRSRCECQSTLVATLDERRFVVDAYAVDRHGNRESAPAHSIHAERPRFDVGWLCNFCGRNTLRSFVMDALAWVELPDPPPPAPPTPPAKAPLGERQSHAAAYPTESSRRSVTTARFSSPAERRSHSA
jgi:hypothetical protein